MNNGTYTEEEFFLNTEAAQFLIRETGEAFYVRALGSNYYQIKEYDLVYMDIYKPEYAIKLSAKNIAFEDKKKIVPLYVAFCIQDMFLCRLYGGIPFYMKKSLQYGVNNHIAVFVFYLISCSRLLNSG